MTVDLYKKARGATKPFDLEDLPTGKEITILLHLLTEALITDVSPEFDVQRQSFRALLGKVKKWSGKREGGALSLLLLGWDNM